MKTFPEKSTSSSLASSGRKISERGVPGGGAGRVTERGRPAEVGGIVSRKSGSRAASDSEASASAISVGLTGSTTLGGGKGLSLGGAGCFGFVSGRSEAGRREGARQRAGSGGGGAG